MSTDRKPADIWKSSTHAEYPTPEGSINGLMLGSGFTRAVHPEAPSWGSLIETLAKLLGQEAPASKQWFVEGLRLSRNTSPRRRGAHPTRFQSAVREVVTAATPRQSADSKSWAKMKDALDEFLRATGTTVIIDTNYDSTLEYLLEDAKRPFTRLIGSEATWVGPLPSDNALIVWKIHGSVDAAATIVLSPTEYQRIYEANALGPVLQQLGASLECLWVVGCGLGDDETWAYLCSEAGPQTIACLWQTEGPTCPTEAPRGWWEQVSEGERSIRLYWAPVPTPDAPCPSLAEHLSTISTKVVAASFPKRRIWWDKRLATFDKEYMIQASPLKVNAALAVVARYREEFTTLRNYLLSQTSRGMGKTWCPSVPTDGVFSAEKKLELAGDFAAVAKHAMAFFDEGTSLESDTPGLLVASAVQSAIAYVVELADVLGIDVHVKLEGLPSDELAIGKGQALFVGINPFDIRPAEVFRANPLHVYTTKSRLPIAAPLTAGTTSQSRPLEEDDWEAAVIYMYRRRCPKLEFEGGHEVEILNLPPLYPWGFRFLDIHEYRACTPGTISRKWHLVRQVEGDFQVCKGGGLRDSSRIAFRIGNRGRVRIGEFDAFIEPAYTSSKLQARASSHEAGATSGSPGRTQTGTALVQEEPGSLTPLDARSLLAEAARAKGWNVVLSGAWLRLSRNTEQAVAFRWPPAPDPSKLYLPRLAARLSYIRPCPTKSLPAHPALPPWIPGCVKPSRGSNGVGFQVFSNQRQWAAIQKSQVRSGRTTIVQPLLKGTEYRITVTRGGDYAIAQLLDRRGPLTKWTDRTASVRRELAEDVWRLGQQCASPVIGVDLIASEDGALLLDVNLGPAIGIHLVTEQPRDLAPSILDAWLGMKRAENADLKPGAK